MKSLKDYIRESSEAKGHWVEYDDEDTGELVKIFVPDVDPEEIKKQAEKAATDSKAYQNKLKKDKELMSKLDKIQSDIWSNEDELKEVCTKLKQSRINMEDELGQMYASGDSTGAEKKAQEYADNINKLSDVANNYQQTIKSLYKQLNGVKKQLQQLWNS